MAVNDRISVLPPPSDNSLKRLGDFDLCDLESVWLILSGASVIDWQRISYQTEELARQFLDAQLFDLTLEADRARMAHIKSGAIDFLRRQFDFPIPRPLQQADMLELLRVASSKGHRQLCACIILKAMHIIHHVDARELQYSIALSDQDLFRLVEERVYRLVGQMLAEGLPITEFVGGRKRRDSIYSKLLSKREAHASTVYDKQRFRIVTRSIDDIMPVLLYLSQRLFPFNYVVPNESINTLIHFRNYCENNPHLRSLSRRMKGAVGDDLSLSDNRFSAESYRIIHFVVDVPVRVPDAILEAAPPHVRALGPIIFGLCEFQMVDCKTEDNNERGDASHASYKDRQRQAVRDRLRMGSASKRRPKKK